MINLDMFHNLQQPVLADQIIEELSRGGMGVVYKVRNFPMSAFQRMAENFRIPTFFVGTCEVHDDW